MRTIACFTLLLLAAALPAEGLLIRADRDDAEYLELATRYPSAIRIEAIGGEGVLIAPRWLLTSAQRARTLEGSKAWAPIEVSGRRHAIHAFFVHPEWRGRPEFDIALVFLRDPVADVVPTPIYRERDEDGDTVRIVGHGETGVIGAGRTTHDGRKRAGINTVDRLMPTTFELRIKGPDDASDLQGVAAHGESGAPAFVEIDGRILVMGIVSTTDARKVGDRQVCVRLSSFAQWIDDTMFRAALDESGAPKRR